MSLAIEKRVAAHGVTTPEQYLSHVRLPCPALRPGTGECLAYGARPIECRIHVRPSAEECRRRLEAGNRGESFTLSQDAAPYTRVATKVLRKVAGAVGPLEPMTLIAGIAQLIRHGFRVRD